MGAVEDRRVRRTRNALHVALLSLMAEKGYAAVTVTDLIDRADVGRSTFYAHFTDKADLLDDALAGLAALLDPGTAHVPDRRRPLRFAEELFAHVHDQGELLTALLVTPGSPVVVDRIEAILTGVVRREVEALAAVSARPVVPLDLLTADVVASAIACLRWWVAGGMAASPEQVERWFTRLAGPSVRSALPPPAVTPT